MRLKSSGLVLAPLFSLIIFSPMSFADDGINKLFSFDGSYRLRYESLDNAYRSGASGGDQLLVSRLLASARMHGKHVFGELEMQDSRSWLDDAGTPLGTDDVNTAEPLQYWVGWREAGHYQVKAGRQTLDIGSRRMVARNRFRNTLNAFDGLYGSYQQAAFRWQAFYLLPVERRSQDRNALDGNHSEHDRQSDDVFRGLHMTYSADTEIELYYYDLDEADNGADIQTVGFRHIKASSPHHWHYEIEAAYQSGETGNLDVKAAMVHADLGYQFADVLSSKIDLMADYASGDDDPSDGESNRFDTLFGARRFDFGPTGIYGAFARTNVLSPGLKWSFKPRQSDSAFIAYRAIWLDSVTDSLAKSGVRDASGHSGRFVGQQLEARWHLHFSDAVQLELGGAYLFKGDFLDDAPNAPEEGNTSYVYSQLAYHF